MQEIQLDDYCILWDNQTIWPNRTNAGAQFTVPECHLVSGLFPSEIFHFENDPHWYICSGQLRMQYLILRYLRCSISFQVSKLNFGGFRDPETKRWNGILSLFDQENENEILDDSNETTEAKLQADFIPHIFTLSFHREEVIYMDMVVSQNHLMTILSYPKYLQFNNSPAKLLECFELKIWLLILLSIAMFGLVNIGFTHKLRFSQLSLYQIVISYFEMFAILFGQGSDVLFRGAKNQLRNPQFIWLFASFLFRLLYSSNITAMFLSRTPEIIDRFDHITKVKHGMAIFIETNSSTEVNFIKHFHWLSNQLVHFDHNEMSTFKTIEELIRANNVMITNRVMANYIQKAYRRQVQLHISEEGLVTVGGNYAIRKSLNHRYRRKLSRIFRWVHYFGLVNRIDRTLYINNFVALHQKHPELGLEQLLEKMRHASGHKISSNILNGLDSESPNQPNSSVNSSILLSVYLIEVGLAGLCLTLEIVTRNFPKLYRMLCATYGQSLSSG